MRTGWTDRFIYICSSSRNETNRQWNADARARGECNMAKWVYSSTTSSAAMRNNYCQRATALSHKGAEALRKYYMNSKGVTNYKLISNSSSAIQKDRYAISVPARAASVIRTINGIYGLRFTKARQPDLLTFPTTTRFIRYSTLLWPISLLRNHRQWKRKICGRSDCPLLIWKRRQQGYLEKNGLSFPLGDLPSSWWYCWALPLDNPHYHAIWAMVNFH